ncbi:probable G-protein coupled receptor 25 [Dendropsophus ebraccatus]|uniref:probable G-protein coupled receptor 25 n=1 Tax=Dendropsophus ebraccatus TaxID=150705 RepID=UPI0038319BA0
MTSETQMDTYDDLDEYDYLLYYGNDSDCIYQELPHAHWILPTLYSIFFLVGFLGNVVVIVVVSKRSSRRADTFILNLAVSDLLFILTLPLWACSLAQGYWTFGDFLCKASGFIITITRCASSLLMAVMSVDRYVAVMKGKKMHPLRTRSCSLGSCCAIWATSILVGCPTLVSKHLDVADSSCVDSNGSQFSLGYRLALIVLAFILPFAVVLFCYCSMAKYLWSYFGKQMRAITGPGKPRRGHSWLRIVTCVVGAFCLSWLPFTTLNTIDVISQMGIHMPCSTKVAARQALTATAALAFANSCSNPLIYSLLDDGFRRRAQLSLPGLFLKCRSMLPSPVWSVPTTSVSMDSTSTYTGI